MLNMQEFHGRIIDLDTHIQPSPGNYELAGGEVGRNFAQRFVEVIKTLPPNLLIAAAISKSHVATYTSSIFFDISARRRTCSIIGKPLISCNIFPGNLTDAICAGITAIIFILTY
jgi:hypothetical protein